MDLQDGAAMFPSLDKEGKPRPEATAGVVRTIVEGQATRTTPMTLRDRCRCAPHPLLNPRRGAFLEPSPLRSNASQLRLWRSVAQTCALGMSA
jgi:hypothetical protein